MDPFLEMAEVQRRLYEAGGPAVLFENVKGSRFPAVCNLYGTMDRCHFMFRDTIETVKKVIALKADPSAFFKSPFSYFDLPKAGLTALPGKHFGAAPVMESTTSISELPWIQSWPMDGGPFVTLPQVYSENPNNPRPMKSNIGMYRVQLAGNEYTTDAQIGIHYQIHRGIGVHHAAALERGEKLKVSVFVGGPPSHSFAAVMPLPEGLAEVMFAGMLGGKRWTYKKKDGFTISAKADFCIVGEIEANTMPEGPFGDHLGYYSLQHEFPVLKVHQVYCRKDAIWPFTVVGRPPQEDTSFGHLIHELTGPLVPTEISGLHAMNAVDAAGVHPLLLALGSERYVPYGERKPQEILTIANAVLGFNQASLAKYLVICAKEDNPNLDIQDIGAFFGHVLERIDWRRDLHFQTRTTIDTLDYSGTGFNEGSKVVMAAAGAKIRDLSTEIPANLSLPDGFKAPAFAAPGILAVEGPSFSTQLAATEELNQLTDHLLKHPLPNSIPLILLVDDSAFTAAKLNNWLWVTFTRSNPSHDMYGVGATIQHKHWGCTGALVIDARIKPHHAPPLVEDPKVTARVDALAAPGGPLHGIF